MRRDLKTLARFIEVYCDLRHGEDDKAAVELKTHDVAAIAGRPVVVCDTCRRLLAHAFVKRTTCPMEPKPACKRCPSYCYQPQYRRQIREVMKVSGRHLVLRGRVDYLLHLLT